jgi:thiamine pyrophosphokinase
MGEMRVFVIAGSPGGQPPWGLAPGPGERVIAADYGAHTARAWGWPVHMLIGDLDSLPADEEAELEAVGVPVITAPREKDETDLELALAHALEEGAREIVICAALGGRVDHLLANVLLLARPELAGIPALIADGPATLRLMRGGDAEAWQGGGAKERGTVSAAQPGTHPGPEEGGAGGAHLELEGASGDLLSLLPVGGDAVGVTTRGLAYPLHNETLYLGRGRGVSNVFEAGRGDIWLRAGLLLVIHVQRSGIPGPVAPRGFATPGPGDGPDHPQGRRRSQTG